MNTSAHNFIAKPITQGPKHHFFGYYGICPWDATGRYVLCLESDFHERLPGAGDRAVVGMVELATGKFEPLAETRAWNFQKGCMLHWLPTAPDRLIIYNDRQNDRFVSVVLDIHSGERRVLPHPISALSHDGRQALSLNYARLSDMRPVVGYAGLADPFADQKHPTDDGVTLMDTETGEAKVLVSYEEVRAFLSVYPKIQTSKIWFNHPVINHNDSRFTFLVRWHEPGISRKHPILLTAGLQGGNLRLVTDLGASHHVWQTPEHLFGWISMPEGYHYYLVNDANGDYQPVRPDILTKNGHCSFSQDGTWLLTDEYPDEDNYQALLLWHMAEERLVVLERFLASQPFRGEIRCDLHPRWSRDERQVCFDSIHEGTRQVYVMDVSEVLKA